MGDNHFYRIIEDTVHYIEKNRKEQLTLDRISAALNLSKFHLHRLMRHATGIPLMEYIRARKLSSSVDYLLNTDWNILDISLEFGFEHEQSYIRSFKQQFGVTPSRLRKRFEQITITEKFDTGKLKKMTHGVLFEPLFVIKSTSYLTGSRHVMSSAENYVKHTANTAGNEFFYRIHPHIPEKTNDQLYIGLTYLTEEPDRTLYFPSAEVQQMNNLDPMLHTSILPTQKYAAFKYVGDFHPRLLTFHQLQELWDYIYGFRNRPIRIASLISSNILTWG
ncbi:AraC family transcriptional regulator [Paenibacillus endophyticus]|uniref:AraC family transcriptional regulator n=1 Tax=Paenibacillus endophyticus TaxID=1294268 RepID=A0A7W5GAD2_9BACL|nr:helix-turn-helix domain-containing protein [Paenibacillus endophyticus]MBB3151827.1 AraC family transcriptional regulator [Paenibacillus endophyticus]